MQQVHGTVIESLGVYLPPRRLTTEEVLRGCRTPSVLPVESLTGIRARPAVEPGQFSIDLAKEATRRCFEGSRLSPGDIDLVVFCGISRYDGPGFRFSFEPGTGLQLAADLGFDGALVFDVANACAGMFTGVAIADTLLRLGRIRRALVVSGEYVTHLIETAQRELDGLTDPRLACLTLGDAGAAVTLERSDRPGVGFKDLEIYTLGRYSHYCIAKLSRRPQGGAIMLTDAIGLTAVSLPQAVGHAVQMLRRNDWTAESVRHVIPHQTSSMTLRAASQAFNTAYGREVWDAHTVVNNLAERGNTATTSHFVALSDGIESGRVNSGERILFSITGSGVTIGTALYVMDDLPDRLRNGRHARSLPARTAAGHGADGPTAPEGPRARIAGVGVAPGDCPRDTVPMAAAAGDACLRAAGLVATDVDLLVYTGVYRTDAVFEPSIASLVAGAMQMNDDASPQGRHTLAFDVFSGAAGFLHGCYVAAQLIAAGRHETAVVVTSEVEQNRTTGRPASRGVQETGSALLLEAGDAPGAGFVGFAFKSFTEHVAAFVSCGAQDEHGPYLHVERDGMLEETYLKCALATVGELLDAHATDAGSVSLFFVPPGWRGLGERFAGALGVPEDRLVHVDVDVVTGDPFTSSIPLGLLSALRQGRVRSGGTGLIIAVSAGVQVGCALYRF